MSFIWLIVWLVNDSPVFLHGKHEDWLIALVVCVVLDFAWWGSDRL